MPELFQKLLDEEKRQRFFQLENIGWTSGEWMILKEPI